MLKKSAQVRESENLSELKYPWYPCHPDISYGTMEKRLWYYGKTTLVLWKNNYGTMEKSMRL